MSNWQNRIVGTGTEKPDQILANPFNFRHHPQHQKNALEGVLKEVGWVQNVIINKTTGHLIDGHLRVDLAMDKGESEIPVVYVEMTEDEERIALASLDPISGLAEQNQEELDRLLDQIGDINDNDQLSAFFESLHSNHDDDPEEDGEVEDDDAPEVKAETVSRKGDIWLLGDHRVMCGDSTKIDDMTALCDGELVDMVWTDPPYNVDYEGSNGLKIQNDHMSDDKVYQFLYDLFTNAAMNTKPGGAIYIAHADSEGVNFRTAMTAAGFELKQCLIWVKNSLVLGRQDYQWQHEPILYGWKSGAAHKWYGEFNKVTVLDDEYPNLKDMDKSELIRLVRDLATGRNSTVIRHDKPQKNGEHPTMKPVGLIVHMIKNSSARGNTVLDICGGSGSTLIACQKTARKARIMEFDEKYCDVIVRRYQDFTGDEAIHEQSGLTFEQMEAETTEV